mgnify:FL=1
MFSARVVKLLLAVCFIGALVGLTAAKKSKKDLEVLFVTSVISTTLV